MHDRDEPVTEKPPVSVERSAARKYYERTSSSRQLHERACDSMPGGNTRGVVFYPPYPAYIADADGCRLTDVDGNEYVDLLNNYTSLIHGHTPEAVSDSAVDAVRGGMAPGGPTEAEIEWAEHLRDRSPAIERIRFTNSGTEATMHAIRAARAYTGNDVIAKFEGVYHGTHDDAQISVHSPGELAGPADSPNSVPDLAGVPSSKREEVLTLPFNDLDATRSLLDARSDDLAGILIAPLMGSSVVPMTDSCLHGLAEYTRERDIPLIFDEVISFRVAHGGAHEMYDVQPDIVALGKLIGGGFAVGAFGGREEVMSPYDPRGGSDIVHSGTFNANPVTAAAGLTTLRQFDADAITRLDELGEELVENLRAGADRVGISLQVNRVGSLFNAYLSDEPVRNVREKPALDDLRHELFLELLNEGVRLSPKLMGSLSTPMERAEITQVGEAFETALEQLRPKFEIQAPHLLD
jgi:glutamate-1-semialdehyde 2,1-aminomutase